MLLGSKKETVLVEGMMCDNCAHHVKSALEKVDGVKSVAVDLRGKKAVIKVSKELDETAVKAALEEAGYQFAGIER